MGESANVRTRSFADSLILPGLRQSRRKRKSHHTQPQRRHEQAGHPSQRQQARRQHAGLAAVHLVVFHDRQPREADPHVGMSRLDTSDERTQRGDRLAGGAGDPGLQSVHLFHLLGGL